MMVVPPSQLTIKLVETEKIVNKDLAEPQVESPMI